MDLRALYPALEQLIPPTEILPNEIKPIDVETGTVLFCEKDICQGFPLVLAGEVKVSRTSPDGRSLELYRVIPGELCLVSSASLFNNHSLTAQGVASKRTTLLLLPPSIFHQWLENLRFRSAVLGLFAERMADLTALIDAVAFHRLDERLASALLGKGPEIAITHQALADELGTVREIVSRLLKRFEREGWVRLSRERIHICDSQALRHMSSTGTP
jgi:CRP/FNR family transcriptional regulator, anaerobic regulatory protein